MNHRLLLPAANRSLTRWKAVTNLTASLMTLTLISFTAGTAAAQSPDPLLTVVPIQLDPVAGNISIGCTVYARTNCKVFNGANPGMHLLALKRQPDASHLDVPDVIQEGTFVDASAANEFLQSTLQKSPDALVIANGVGNYGFPLNALAKSFEQFGGQTDLEAVASSIPFIFIGNGGQNMGQARQRGNSTRPMNGYLAKDSSGNFKFIQTDYLHYDITADGSIKVGTQTYTVAGSQKSCDGSNSFHLVVVDRETPGTLLVNNTYCTAQSDAEISRLTTDLGTLVTNEGQLAFLASNGHPIPANWNFGTDGDSRLYHLAVRVGQLGGYWETMAYLTPSDTYSLIGAVAPPSYVAGARQRARESSSVYPDKPTGELHGMLARGRGNWYSPIDADTAGIADLGFYDILAQTPVAFPHPAPNNSDEQAAYQYILQRFVAKNLLCSGCNVRDNYGDTNISLDGYQNALGTMPDQNGIACNDSAAAADVGFCTVRQQLLNELAYVNNIRAFNGNLNLLWSASESNSILELLKTYNDVNSNLPAPPAAPAPSLFAPILNLLLGVASYAPEVGPLFGIADAAFNFGSSLTTDSNGNAALSLSTTVGQLETQAINAFTAQASTIGTQFNFIYQDWGKLNTLGYTLANASSGSPWSWNTGTVGSILQAIGPNVEESYYESLMPAVYAIGGYYPDCSNECHAPLVWGQTPIWQQPQAYEVWDQGGPFCFFCDKSAQPFNYPWFPPYTFPTDPTNPIELPSNPAYTQATATILGADQWLGIAALNSPSDGGSNGLYIAPAASILSHLFTPRSQGGLGVYRPAFFEGWPFPRVTCGPSHYSNGDTADFGCNWSAAAPAPETLQSPLASLTVSKSNRSQNLAGALGQMEVPLTFHNNGTVDIQSIQVDNISLRTLAGAGQAVLGDPLLPIQTGIIKPGDSVIVTLQITVPPGITKLAVDEEGTADTGQLNPLRFSFGQVVFPGNN
jgi:hypothetical protein